ncbi:hypothetical protein [Orrella daihaiensis]|uniref:Membrane protein YphA (DoxX/SURF4 family) n=1 Tax=Orrella daihaiensis TaxID=2782176 RepID=A0ABY4AII1_9BURK|nr:hypothetical protein [Orrella daihaiensis]UOD50097.1 hypothetical protein DHf2319_11745 [Orrella daihaiensis]
MPTHQKNVAAIVLFALGCMDLFRGLAHTFMIHWANDTFAHLDLSINGNDQLMLLGAFGISNWLTGMLFILIAIKARALAGATLAIILIAYAIGWLGMQYAGVSPESDFYGRFIMMGYFVVCFTGIVWQHVANRQANT